MNKLPEKRVKELQDYLTNAALVTEELVAIVRNRFDDCEENNTNTDVIRDAQDSIDTLMANITTCRGLLDEVRHADLTPYSPPPISRPD